MFIYLYALAFSENYFNAHFVHVAEFMLLKQKNPKENVFVRILSLDKRPTK